MTIYNAGPYLKEAVDSLLDQSFNDWELIAVENGSSDESLRVLDEYQDNRIRIFALSENIGRTPALRFAFEQARGEFIAVLDSDDISSPDRFNLEVTFLDLHPEVVLVGTWGQYINESSNAFSTWEPSFNIEELHDCLGWMNPIIHSSAMYRMSKAREIGGYPEEFVYAQDYGLIIALAKIGKLAVIPELLCQFRVTDTSMSHSAEYSLSAATEVKMLYQRALKTLSLSTVARRRNKRVTAIYDIKIGVALIRKKMFVEGFKSLIKGVVDDPTALLVNGKIKNILPLLFIKQKFKLK